MKTPPTSKKPYIKRLLLTVITTLLLTGCITYTPASENETITELSEYQFESLYSEAEINYTVPVSVPNIMVNQLGYLSESVKMAIFRGDDLPETFEVINENGNSVYSGKIESRGFNEITGENISYGFFTDVITAGTYYLEARIVGRSYTFVIGDNLYDNIFTAGGRQYYLNRCGISLTEEYAGINARSACHTAKVALREDPLTSLDVSGGRHHDLSGSKDMVTASRVVSRLLLSYELNPAAYSDETNIPESGNQIPDILDEIRYEADWFLKMQDVTTGGVYAGVSVFPHDPPDISYQAFIEPVSVEATKMFCAVMAKFSYLYQEFDIVFATECLKAADRAWRYLERNHTGLMDEMYFLAAVHMYRAAGYRVYHNAIINYLNSEDFKHLFAPVSEDNIWDERQETIMKGAVTYLMTQIRVDRNLCGEIMRRIMLIGEDISFRSRSSKYLTAGNEKQDNNNELLRDMFFLSIVNHIITNHEYGTIIENHLHYFMGRNSAGISYIDDVGALNYRDIDNRLGIMNQIESNSKLLFILSEIKSNAAKTNRIN